MRLELSEFAKSSGHLCGAKWELGDFSLSDSRIEAVVCCTLQSLQEKRINNDFVLYKLLQNSFSPECLIDGFTGS